MTARASSLFALLLLIASFATAGCKGCSEEITDHFFDPDRYGTYEFDGVPDIEGPNRLIFGDVEVGATTRVTAEIRNIGRETLKISQWSISDRFDLSFTSSLTAPEEIRPGESVFIGISHTVVSDDEFRGTLTIDSNDPDEPEFVIALYVNGKFPCLETLPDDVVDFGEVKRGDSRDRTVIIRNCSPNAPTTFDLVGVSGDDAFSFARAPNFPQQQHTLEVGETVEVALRFLPEQPGHYTGALVLHSDDEFRPEHELPLRGVGTAGACPSAVIEGSSSEGNGDVRAQPNATLQTIPLDVLTLRDDSVAHDGKQIERYNWTIVARPQDSSARFTNTADAQNQDLFLDLAGTYVIELRVWDDEDVESCAPARLTVHAVSNEDIHIQLVWDTPADPNQNDTSGSDVDLHLLHPNGTWNRSPYDCFWQNLLPDWGESRPPGVSSFDCERNPERQGCHDDPSLDIDDVDGWGPENINLNNPEPNTVYQVGVHYFSDHGYSISYATVRIFIGGVMTAEFSRQRLVDQEFWHVADIAWPTATITPNGQVTRSFP